MGALILRLSARHGRATEYRRLGGEPLGVGRGFGNGLIVPDAYLGAEQFRIVPEADALWLEVLDRTNPLRLNGVLRREYRIPLAPGDRIDVGHSVFTLLDEHTPVPVARSLAASPWERLGDWRPGVSMFLLLLLAALTGWLDFLKTAEEPQWDQLLFGALSLCGSVMMWAVTWAALGHLMRHQAEFWAQLALAAAVALAWLAAMELSGYIAYAFAVDAGFFIEAASWVLSAVLGFLLLHGALHLATHLRHPGLAALSATLAAYALLGLSDFSTRDDFVAQPQPATVLRAPFAKRQAGRDYEPFDADIAALFAGLPREDGDQESVESK